MVHMGVERVKFDTMVLQHPEIAGIAYQRGELLGWEVRTYLLEKFQRRCVYCSREQVVFELDHVRPRSRGGSGRGSNLVLAGPAGHDQKGNTTTPQFSLPTAPKYTPQP